jgi:hypothetical protein
VQLIPSIVIQNFRVQLTPKATGNELWYLKESKYSL